MSRPTPMFHLKRDLDAADVRLLRMIAGRTAALREHDRQRIEEEKRDVYGRDWKNIVGRIETDHELLDGYLKEAHAKRLIMPLDYFLES